MTDDNTVVISIPEKVKILTLAVKIGSVLNAGYGFLSYQELNEDDSPKGDAKKLKAAQFGIVQKILAKEGEIIEPNVGLLEICKKCHHETSLKDMCADCGADLTYLKLCNNIEIPSFSMIHAVPELKVNKKAAENLGEADIRRLETDRKLVLLVDLDQTLIHTTNDNIPTNIKDVYHFRLYGYKSPWYHTRLRPYTRNFLKKISEKYELHICTFGSRRYAHTVANILDPKGELFSYRILSRDECFDANSKTANLKGLFPCGDNMVCIIDDREDVWNYAKNLIHVKPYHFFKHTGDIHAPLEVNKCESDNAKTEGLDFENLVEKSKIFKKKADDGGGESSKMNEDEKEVEINDKTGISAFEGESPPPERYSESEMSEGEVPFNGHRGELKQCDDNEEKEIEVEDPDDYLLYLEDILKDIHAAFYTKFDARAPTDPLPHLSDVIGELRSKVLSGTRVVFTGMIPKEMSLRRSEAYRVARLLGSVVEKEVDKNTTHLVAYKANTAKMRSAVKYGITTVTPEWLWTCAERWERVDEELFSIKYVQPKSRTPPAHCSSPERTPPRVDTPNKGGGMEGMELFSEEEMKSMRELALEAEKYYGNIDSEDSEDDGDKKSEVEVIKLGETGGKEVVRVKRPAEEMESSEAVDVNSSSSTDSISGETKASKRFKSFSHPHKKAKLYDSNSGEEEMTEFSEAEFFKQLEEAQSDEEEDDGDE